MVPGTDRHESSDVRFSYIDDAAGRGLVLRSGVTAAGSPEGADSRSERDFSGEKTRCGSVTTTDAGRALGVCQRFLYRYAYELACCYYLESGGVIRLDSRGRGDGVVRFVMVSKVHMIVNFRTF